LQDAVTRSLPAPECVQPFSEVRPVRQILPSKETEEIFSSPA